jgi:hypothetical protein
MTPIFKTVLRKKNARNRPRFLRKTSHPLCSVLSRLLPLRPSANAAPLVTVRGIDALQEHKNTQALWNPQPLGRETIPCGGSPLKRISVSSGQHPQAIALPENRPFFSWSLLFLCTLMLSACGSYSGSFDCPIGEGLKCASLSEVNDRIDQNSLNLDFPSGQTEASCKDCRKIWWRSDLTRPRRHYRKGR